MKREIPIDVAGQRLKIRSDEDDEYVERLAAFVDEKMRGISHGQQGVTTLNLALTAALTIADELHKLMRVQDSLDGELDRLSCQIEGGLDG